MSSEVRQRPGKASSDGTATGNEDEFRKRFPKPTGLNLWLPEIGRLITCLFLLSCVLSYVVTGQDFFWGHRPPYTRYSWWKDLAGGPKSMTDAQLLQYDGSDANLPIYLALNGTIYDVSQGRNFYGPGGSYHFFAGHDATRAFVTSCFDTDINPDIRGVEQMYLPKSSAAIDALYTSGELKTKKEQEMRHAHVQVRQAIEHWEKFFSGSPKYRAVGTVRREKGWQTRGPVKELCQKAKDARPTRGPPAGKAVPAKPA